MLPRDGHGAAVKPTRARQGAAKGYLKIIYTYIYIYIYI